MSTDENAPSDIPTRAIHEGYLEMQRARRQYRQAADAGDEAAINRAHGQLQEAVIGFYELMRPHLKHNKAVEDYWEGKPPRYRGNGTPPDPEDGVAVLHQQQRQEAVDVPQGIDAEELTTFEGWHDALDVSDDIRLVGLYRDNGRALVTFRAYQVGLHNLDNWETRVVVEEEEMDGFMAGHTETRKRQVRVDVERLTRAARALAEAADELGFLSPTELPTEQDPAPI